MSMALRYHGDFRTRLSTRIIVEEVETNKCVIIMLTASKVI